MSRPVSQDPAFEAAEYTRKAARRRQGGAKESGASSGAGRLRLLFFGIASVWGFLIGALTIGVAASVSGAVERFPALVVVALVPGAGLALAGGAAAASAYREARRRSR